jgi:hypothetical protein
MPIPVRYQLTSIDFLIAPYNATFFLSQSNNANRRIFVYSIQMSLNTLKKVASNNNKFLLFPYDKTVFGQQYWNMITPG